MRPGILFSGQGAQSVGMGKTLLSENPNVGKRLEQADSILGWELSKIMFDGPTEALTETRVCQPALFVHGIMVFELLMSKGIIDGPAAVSGLSLGEVTALTAGGAMDFETGLRLVAERGRLMQEACEATKGSMASVIGGTREAVADFAEECGVEMANLNCPGQIVISGVQEGIDKAVSLGRERGFKLVKELVVAGAYHSRLMESARDQFAPYVMDAAIEAPKCPFYANVTGARIESPEKIREGLIAQVVSSVLFEDDLRALAADQVGPVELVECGPGKIIAGMIRRVDRSWSVRSFAEAEDFAVPAAS
ncbi:ACP S-malonyltransferase [Puniceicoccus vermicola]|uniref:Malonyl CoA-acyl carrier protein transacylase n=1 Tax=Puniceicoccus vermicola TaxID=388746 RepID=A0A7X1E6A5_9BACT|nr:ACP S-malonyltransferase [Puniceicoccus vermicola]